ncbi:hypothetical protein EG68_03392 [Paragonimus skrjabini miyazakii]|uniref:FERM domain-containing protein n=1 Tax=Paragonimus skrjabini miyazakii TaxID=59628 RepID=A0A8S9Z4P2_9TREM|nr:hypothetical protein EG68_03392 [Paragonimus skrjabini miyazakii]
MHNCSSTLASADSDEEIWHLRDSVRRTLPNCSATPCISSTRDIHSASNRSVSSVNPIAFDDGRVQQNNNVVSAHNYISISATCNSKKSSLRRTLSNIVDAGHRWLSGSKSFASRLRCHVVSLDGQCLVFHLHETAFGYELFNLVTNRLELGDAKYFGLVYFLNGAPMEQLPDWRYHTSNSVEGDDVPETQLHATSVSESCDLDCPVPQLYCSELRSRYNLTGSHYHDDVPFWLQLDQRIIDQCKGYLHSFQLQVKYFVPNPDVVVDCPNSRRQLCLQLRQYLLNGS